MQLEAKRKRERERERGGRRGEGRTFSVSENMRARAISPRKARPVVQDATPRRFAVVAHARAEVVNFYRSNISRSSCNSCDENAVKPKIHKPGGKLKAISPLVTTRERISRHSSLNSTVSTAWLSFLFSSSSSLPTTWPRVPAIGEYLTSAMGDETDRYSKYLGDTSLSVVQWTAFCWMAAGRGQMLVVNGLCGSQSVTRRVDPGPLSSLRDKRPADLVGNKSEKLARAKRNIKCTLFSLIVIHRSQPARIYLSLSLSLSWFFFRVPYRDEAFHARFPRAGKSID